MARTHGRDLTGDEMCEILDEFVNGAGEPQIQDFVAKLVHRTHRTLQQKIMGLFMRSIETWAVLQDSQYDLRNEATVKLCRKIVSATGDKYDRNLPLI